MDIFRQKFSYQTKPEWNIVDSYNELKTKPNIVVCILLNYGLEYYVNQIYCIQLKKIGARNIYWPS